MSTVHLSFSSDPSLKRASPAQAIAPLGQSWAQSTTSWLSQEATLKDWLFASFVLTVSIPAFVIQFAP